MHAASYGETTVPLSSIQSASGATGRTFHDTAFEVELIALIPKIRAFAHHLCGDATWAEDLAQGALSNAWAARSRFQMGTNLKAWTFLILRNLFYSENRRTWRSQPLDSHIAENTLVMTSSPDARLELDEVRRALEMLTQEQREAVLLIGLGGLTYDEVSDLLDESVGTIKSRVSRGRSRLIDLFGRGGFDIPHAAPSAAESSIFSQLWKYENQDTIDNERSRDVLQLRRVSRKL